MVPDMQYVLKNAPWMNENIFLRSGNSLEHLPSLWPLSQLFLIASSSVLRETKWSGDIGRERSETDLPSVLPTLIPTHFILSLEDS